MLLKELREEYHRAICSKIVRIKVTTKHTKYPNFCDSNSKNSVQIGTSIVSRLDYPLGSDLVSEQTAGKIFENITRDFLEKSFALFHEIRPGDWRYETSVSSISKYDQYEHLAQLAKIAETNTEIMSVLGGNYLVKPDIVICRMPVSDKEINAKGIILKPKEKFASLSPLRSRNSKEALPILHASVSCKWTIRSDRSQSTKTEVLNLIRNRKGHTPHIVAVTAEPTPNRIATLALGTGDLDCVYHFALYELIEAIKETKKDDALELLNQMIAGRRLRDISDLPLDLAI